MFTPVLLLKKKIGIQFNLLPKKRYEEKDKIYYLGKDNCLFKKKRIQKQHIQSKSRFVKRGVNFVIPSN